MWILRRHARAVVADTVGACKMVLDEISGAEIVGVDVETYGPSPNKQHPKGCVFPLSIQFATETGFRAFVPLWSGSSKSIVLDGNLKLLRVFSDWLESDDVLQKVGHNFKYDKHALANVGITVRGDLGDTLVMDYLANNGAQLHGLKEVVRREFVGREDLIAPYTVADSTDYRDEFRTPAPLKRKGKNGETLYGKRLIVPPLTEVIRSPQGVKQLIKYGIKDPFFTVRVYELLRERLRKTKWRKTETESFSYFDYYETFERPFSQVLFDMEREGCPLDMDKLVSVSARLDEDIDAFGREFMKQCVKAGASVSRMREINIDSTKQLGELLFRELKIKRNRKMDTATGQPSVAKSALEWASKASPRGSAILTPLMERSTRVTLRKMFVRKLVALAPEYGNHAHSTFKQTGTATMRLSSAAQNLENIPTGKKDDIYQLRSCFVARDPETELVADIDLSQIEVRITAHVTREEKLIDLLKNGHDQHLTVMCDLFPEVKEFVAGRPCTKELNEEGEAKFGKATWGEWRRRAKVLNFGVIYGMGPKGAAAQLGITKEEATEMLAAYFEGLPDLQRGIKRVQAGCYKNGYVRTLLGRYAVIPGIRSSDFALRGAAERQAFNYVIQGSAADMLKMGMILCHFDKKLRAWNVRMINQIHDELVFLIPKKHFEKAKPLIEDYISHPYRYFTRYGLKDLVVDTPADLGCGPNWMEAKK